MTRPISTRIGIVAAVLLLSVPVSAQQTKGKPKDEPGVRWDEDSIRFGDSVRIDPRVRVR